MALGESRVEGAEFGLAAGAVIALGLWFLSGLAPEFRHKKEEEADKAGDRSDKTGKEAAEA